MPHEPPSHSCIPTTRRIRRSRGPADAPSLGARYPHTCYFAGVPVKFRQNGGFPGDPGGSAISPPAAGRRTGRAGSGGAGTGSTRPETDEPNCLASYSVCASVRVKSARNDKSYSRHTEVPTGDSPSSAGEWVRPETISRAVSVGGPGRRVSGFRGAESSKSSFRQSNTERNCFVRDAPLFRRQYMPQDLSQRRRTTRHPTREGVMCPHRQIRPDLTPLSRTGREAESPLSVAERVSAGAGRERRPARRTPVPP